MSVDRRTVLGATAVMAGLAATPAVGRTLIKGSGGLAFPQGFLWGAATAGHQVEGNDTASDTWLMANIVPTVFKEPVGDAVDSFHRWPEDLDLCVAMGLNSYRFSVEWSRIEPEQGRVSQAMLDHYARMVEGCHQRGLKPIVTLNHFTAPRWFAAAGAWINPSARGWYAAQCERVARHFGDGIDHALTFNEPNLFRLLEGLLPPQVREIERMTLDRAAAVTGSQHFVATNVVRPEDADALEQGLLAAHREARAALKSVRSTLPVGVSLAIVDEQAVRGGEKLRDETRRRLYDTWLDSARGDDFVGVQNYERRVWGPQGRVAPAAGAVLSQTGQELDGASLAGAIRYAFARAKVPVLVTEHGTSTTDDALRARMIPEALRHLHGAMADGVPVRGYCHWSLLDNFEWIFGYGPKYGLHSVDPVTFRRTAKPSAAVYGAIARANAV